MRAAKFIFGLHWNTPTEKVRMKYNWKTLKNTYLKLLVMVVHKCYHVRLKSLFKNYLLNDQAHTRLEKKTVYPCQDVKRKL